MSRISILAVIATAALVGGSAVAGAAGESPKPLFAHSCSRTCGAIQVGEVHGTTDASGSARLAVPPRRVFLAPGGSAQRIELEYRIHWWDPEDGRYHLYSRRPSFGSPRLAPGRYWIDEEHSFPVPAQRFHTVDLVIRWYTASGRPIGTRIVGFDNRRDYVCGDAGCSIDVVGGDGAIYNASGSGGDQRDAG